MPRLARQKISHGIFHIMGRSISEIDLFKEHEDKLKYFSLIKKYQGIYIFKIYAYCLMKNHFHIMIDANGADISKIMHSINFSYAQYFNRKYNRHGHLFQDRFKSKLVTNQKYLLALSAYIHNNPAEIVGYENCPEKYEYSSLAVYLGLHKDSHELIEDEFVMSLLGKNKKKARIRYLKLVYKSNDNNLKEEIEFQNEGTEYRSGRTIIKRDFKAEDIVKFVVTRMKVAEISLSIKHLRPTIEAKALIVILMRGLCNLKCGDICRYIGDITNSRISKLSSIGVNMVNGNEKYEKIVEEFMMKFAS